MQSINYKSHVLYYTDDWNGVIYKNKKGDQYSIKQFKQLTGLDFEQFHQQVIVKKSMQVKHSQQDKLQKVLHSLILEPSNTMSVLKTKLNSLKTNLQYMSAVTIADLLVKNDLAKYKTRKTTINYQKKQVRNLLSPYILESNKTTIIAQIPELLIQSIITNLLKLDPTVIYAVE